MVLIREPESKTQRVHVIGLGVREKALLSDDACIALRQADVVVGSERQLNTIAHIAIKGVKKLLPPLCDFESWLGENNYRTIVVLASGDPLFYGIGHWLSQHIEKERLVFYPGVSSIQVACHILGISMQYVEVINLHGRPLKRLRASLRRHRYYAVLSDSQSDPYALAQECHEANFSETEIWVGERLGYQDQLHRSFTAASLLAMRGTKDAPEFNALHVSLLFTKGDGGVLPEFPGIPDLSFQTGDKPGSSLLSKREVRLAALSLLQPAAEQVAWDIGAGCGGIAIEWARWNPYGQVFAVERHPQRLEYLRENRDRFGVDRNLNIVAGTAPQCLESLPAPDAIFIGGNGGKLAEILEFCWQCLKPGGCIVASAVTETSKGQLHSFAGTLQTGQSQQPNSESVQIAISRGGQLAGEPIYRPQIPVTLMKWIKPQIND